jgi:hypothetical protein
MPTSAKKEAAKVFAETKNKGSQAVQEKEKAQRERAAHQAGLRALRLAKEADDKKSADKA